jgi:polyisoprenoid-binding protein YceI
MSTQLSEITTYAIDPVHSTAEFVIRHLMITKVRGNFAAFTGTIELQANRDIPYAVQATIDASSVSTRESQRDAHLKSADFFDVEKYPTIEFASTRIEGTTGDFTIHGKLTMHGVTRDVALKAEFEGRGPDPYGGQRIGYTASTTINRKDYGLTWNAALETGGVALSDEVRIELNVQGVLKA